jgi:raffinose/stachyose/melibiose transport system substrate-binding protein
MRPLTRHRGALAVLATCALLTACGGGGGGGGANADGTVTLTWWHNATADPGKAAWQQVADAYHRSHPKVSFKVVPIQNEQFQTKVPVALQGNDPPDIYQQWGGGAEATQVKSGKLMDMTASTKGWIGEIGDAAKGWQVDGKQYGIPYDVHAVGFWYRKDIFAKAGITSPPRTMDEFDSDVAKLKAKGIVPVAVGSKDKWPDAFWWEYFAIRECPQATIEQAVEKLSIADACFHKAGEDLETLLASKPFQRGYASTPAQQGAGSSAGLVANGKAAMELQGDWELAVMPSLATDKNFASKLGWFPFPSVPGGAGEPDAALGGGDGFSCTVNATSACPDFLRYISSAAVQKKLAKASAVTLPANPAANTALTDPTLKQVQKYRQQASYTQLYFDTAFPTSVGQALNDEIATMFAGKGTPDSIVKAVAQAAASQ